MTMANLSRIDLNLLVVLEAIASEGGVSRAAEKLNLTQPAISHALARLREALGDPLFVRQGRNLAPTALTKRLIVPLRRSLQSLGALIEKGGSFDPQRTEASFVVALRDPMEMLVLPVMMRGLAGASPSIDLRTVQVRRRSVEAGLADGTLDVVLDVALPLSERIHRRRVTSDGFVVVMRRGHPALRRGFTLAGYLALEHIMVTSRGKGPGPEDLELGQRGLHRRVRLRCRNYLAAFQVVRETDLALTMPERYAALLNGAPAVRTVRLPIKMAPLDLYLYWHDRVDGDPANRWLRALLQSAFERPRRSVSSATRRG